MIILQRPRRFEYVMGNGLIGTIGGGAAAPFDIGSVALDGVNDFVKYLAAVAVNWNYAHTQALTFALRLYVSSNTTLYLYNRANLATIRGVAIYAVAGVGGLNIGMQLLDTGSNQIRTDCTDNSLPINTWTSVFCVNDGAGAVLIHINTSTPAQTNGNIGSVTNIQDATPNATLGIRGDESLFPFPGWITNFAIYTKAATLAERTAWHNKCVALGNPTNDIANCASFFSFNTDANDSVGSVNGTLTNGAFIDSFVG